MLVDQHLHPHHHHQPFYPHPPMDHHHHHHAPPPPTVAPYHIPAVQSLFIPDSNALPIILPEIKSLGRIWIPFNFIERTNGVDRFFNNHPHPPSLCMLYQKGRCHVGEKCNQIHVDRLYIRSVTDTLTFTAVNNCCMAHGDLASISNNLFELSQPESIELRIEGQPTIYVPVQKVAITLFWYRFLQQRRKVLFFVPERVCNLHQINQCKYGVECKNVHICREFWAEFTAAHPFLAPPSTTPQCTSPSVDPTGETPSSHQPLSLLSPPLLQLNSPPLMSSPYLPPGVAPMDVTGDGLHSNPSGEQDIFCGQEPATSSAAYQMVLLPSGDGCALLNMATSANCNSHHRPSKALPIVDPMDGTELGAIGQEDDGSKPTSTTTTMTRSPLNVISATMTRNGGWTTSSSNCVTDELSSSSSAACPLSSAIMAMHLGDEMSTA